MNRVPGLALWLAMHWVCTQYLLSGVTTRALLPVSSFHPFRNLQSERHSCNSGSRCASDASDDKPLEIINGCARSLVEAEAIVHSLRYRIVAEHAVKEDTPQRILSMLVQESLFASSSDARKACQQGEIVVVRGSKRIWMEANKCSSSKLPFLFDDLTVLVNSKHPLFNTNDNDSILVASALTCIKKDDVVLRITREPNEACYPVELTGHVQPPAPNIIPWPTVIYQDEHIAVVHKPESIPTIGVPRKDLQSILPFCLSPPSNKTLNAYWPQFVHPLDQRISGLLLVAKTQKSMEKLRYDFETDKVFETYIALVFGSISEDSGTLEYSVANRFGVSDWRVVNRHRSLTILQVQPKMCVASHEIPRDLYQCLGTTVIGNSEYDTTSELLSNFDQEEGLFLCSNAIAFCHPATNEPMEFSIKVPCKFERMLVRAEEFELAKSQQQSRSKTSFTKHLKFCKSELDAQFTTEEGRGCTGEPPVDPSRMINPNLGDSEWMEN